MHAAIPLKLTSLDDTNILQHFTSVVLELIRGDNAMALEISIYFAVI